MIEFILINVAILWIGFVALSLLTVLLLKRVASPNSPRRPSPVGLAHGSRLPAFTGTRLDATTYNSQDDYGHSVAFVVVSPTCRPCHDLMPVILAAKTKADHNGSLLHIVCLSSFTSAESLALDLGLPQDVIASDESDIAEALNVRGTPAYLFYSDAGTLISSGVVQSDFVNRVGEWLEGPKHQLHNGNSHTPNGRRSRESLV